MKLSLLGLQNLCKQHVVELIFNKRTSGQHRRMLATLDFNLLNSDLGKEIFKFNPPRYSPPFDASSKGLITLFDLIMLDWRNVPASQVEVVSAISTNPPVDFWTYFDKFISKMTALQKASFMTK